MLEATASTAHLSGISIAHDNDKNKKNGGGKLSVQKKTVLRCSLQQTPGRSATRLDETLARIQEARVIACVRAESAELAVDMARTALDGGLNVLEVTMTTPGAAKAITTLVKEYPLALIGAGTVLSTMEADIAEAAGAKFMMSPVALEHMIHAYCTGPTLFIPGAISPTEIYNAYRWGARLVKLYPVAVMGGIKLIQALKKSMHQIPLVASQGIMADTFEQYLAAGAMAVVLSDAIFNKTHVQARDFEKIKQQASEIAEKAAAFSNSTNP